MGRCLQLRDTIQHLYDIRRQLNREGNPAQLVFMLLLNSACGRSVFRPIETDTVAVPEDRFERYASMTYHWIERAEKVGDRHYVKKACPANEQWNHCQAGARCSA